MHFATWGFMRLPSAKSGLPVEIWVDDSQSYKYFRWERRIIYHIPAEEGVAEGLMGFMTISDNPVEMDWGDTPKEFLQPLKDFVTANQGILEFLSDGEIDHGEFLEQIK